MSGHTSGSNGVLGRRNSVEPSYFRSGDEMLFGCYHAPAPGQQRDCGIVVCQSIGHEYIWCHRACRSLAAQLSRRGFHVFRFDVSNCGDSSGNSGSTRLETWVGDVLAACDRLGMRRGVRRLSVVGLRLGGTLAALAGNRRRDFDRIVLWQPVVSGFAYLEELAGAHLAYEQAAGYSSRSSDDVSDDEQALEVIGHAYPPALRDDLTALDLTSELRQPPARRVLLIENGEKGSEAPLRKQLETLSRNVTARHCPDPEIWLAEPYKMLMPRSSINLIVSWFSEEQS